MNVYVGRIFVFRKTLELNNNLYISKGLWFSIALGDLILTDVLYVTIPFNVHTH